MSRIRTSAEIKQRYLDKMGPELGALYHELLNDTFRLHMNWDEYVALYGTNPSRITLLNRAAPRFFRIVEDALFRDTMLHLSRLTDAPKTSGRDNLTIRRLPPLIKDASLITKAGLLISEALKKTEFCRDWRNRRIAHHDLGLAMRQTAQPLQPASRAQIREALDAIAAVLNAVEGHFMNSEHVFRVVCISDGAEALLYVLDDGIRAGEDRKSRIKARTYKPEDLAIRRL